MGWVHSGRRVRKYGNYTKPEWHSPKRISQRSVLSVGHADAMTPNRFPYYRLFEMGIYRLWLDSLHKGPDFMFSLLIAWQRCWVIGRYASAFWRSFDKD